MSADLLIARFSEQPEKCAVVSPAGRCSFGDLVESCRRWGEALDREGVGAGTVVELRGDFSPASIALFATLTTRGAIIVPESRADRCGREERAALAEVEARCAVSEDDQVRIERAGRTASHELYRQLRRRGHPGLVQFSSGTSGRPKVALHDLTHLLEKFEVRRPAWTTLAFLLFDHLGGINTMLHTLSNGATLVAAADRSPDPVCEVIESNRVELLPATPSFLSLLLLSGAHRRHDLSTLRVISYGAEPMPEATLGRLHEAFPNVRLQQTYGLVELGALRTKSHDDASLWVKVGGEGYETRVVEGELQVRARSMLLGYLNAPTPITTDGWLRTGDMVEQDGDYIRFLGRESDRINVGGEKVYPVEVEGVIESMDDVVEATVYGEPNALMGQIVCARVRTVDEVDEAEFAREVKRVCRGQLDRFKVPIKVAVTDTHQTGARLKKVRRQS